MEEGRVFPTDTIFGNLENSTVDFELMDELLLGGCWLETAGGSDFLQPASTSFFDPSYFLPSSEINSSCLNPDPFDSSTQEETERSVPPSDVLQTEISLNPRSMDRNPDRIAESSTQLDCYLAEGGSELGRTWWVAPMANPCSISSVTERLAQALQFIKSTTASGDVLVQIWVPIKKGDKRILTTDDQPYTLCGKLTNYRNVSVNYHFPADEDSNESAGLPGRVFLGEVPEWTPDVQYFNSDEYPRIGYAHKHNVHGTIALPIFERGNRTCLGVLEVVMTTQKIKYGPELENICKALEAVDLRSSEVSSDINVKVCNESYQAAVPEILEVLRAVCETHKLSLAQTWVPCSQQGKGGCRHSDENYAYCISTVDSACCVTDPGIQGFHDACSEHHLFRGQGVVGQALLTNQPCFKNDINTFSKKDYPLVHYAKMFGLGAAVAIRLRSVYSGMVDYVLEFFLPVDCQDTEEQTMMLHSLSNTIQRVCRTLRVVTDKEMEEEAFSKVSEGTYGLAPGSSQVSSQSTWFAHVMEAQKKGKNVQKEEPEELFKVTSEWDNPEVVLHQKQSFSDFKQHRQDSTLKNSVECVEDSSFADGSFSSVTKSVEKRRTKTEKSISLQVLRQYFAGSLKDAAKSIGVCPTTLKRICRQHGITRWPSRKIKKVGHSLRKLQVVIDSVQGAEGAFQLGSFYPNLSGTNLYSKSKVNDHVTPLNIGSEDGSSPRAAEGLLSPLGTASKSASSSCSQGSSSSLSFSIGKQQNPPIVHLTGNIDVAKADTLKRARSDAELCALVQEEEGRRLARSQSHKLFSEDPNLPSQSTLLKSRRRDSHGKATLRVKVTYGEEKVRFSMQYYWRFEDLQQEIAKRFNIDDMSRIDLKYLDDDSEWVLLTCDADVEECIDVYKSLQSHTIKLSVHQVPPPNFGKSWG